MAALSEYEDGLCSCGYHRDMADDEDSHFKLEKRVCPVCASTDRFDRMQAKADEDERAKDDSADREDPADGRKIGIRYLGRHSEEN